MKKVGFTIGKFAPFHKGHQLVIEKALKEMDKVYVIIYETDLINFTVEQRAKWIKEKYKNIEILYAFNPPKQYGLDKESVEIQMTYLKNIIEKVNPTHFYNSEKYGEYVAKYLNIKNVQVDIERKIVPISATKIRRDLEKYKKFLDKKVYNEIRRKINV